MLPTLNMDPLPQIDLRHLLVLSDDTGIMQHATRSTPDLHHGYCTDDNARSLIAAVMVLDLPKDRWGVDEDRRHEVVILTQRYLAFLAYAFNDEAGRFRNFMQYNRAWLEEVGSEDSHARTVWGLGKAYRQAPTNDIQDLSESIIRKAMPAVESFEYIRPWAYAILGIEEYLRVAQDDFASQLHERMATRLFDIYREHATSDWPWWEDWLTWGNAKLPHAMMNAGVAMGREDMVAASLESLRWLLEIQTAEDGHLSIIGNDGWYLKGKPRSQYAQQPIEAKALVQACLAAAWATGDGYWTDQAVRCFQWFTGRNDAGLPLYNAETGGGNDGLESYGVNANQGAESTLAYLMSVLELHHYDAAVRAQ